MFQALAQGRLKSIRFMKKKLLVIKILNTLFLVLIKIIKTGIAPRKIFFTVISWENYGGEKGLATFFL